MVNMLNFLLWHFITIIKEFLDLSNFRERERECVGQGQREREKEKKS